MKQFSNMAQRVITPYFFDTRCEGIFPIYGSRGLSFNFQVKLRRKGKIKEACLFAVGRSPKITGDQVKSSYRITPLDLRTLLKVEKTDDVFVCLVCGDEHGECTLTLSDLSAIISLDSNQDQYIHISTSFDKSFQVSGPKGQLPKKVPKSSFLKTVFS